MYLNLGLKKLITYPVKLTKNVYLVRDDDETYSF